MPRNPRLVAATLGLLFIAPIALSACATPAGSSPSGASASPAPTNDTELEAAWLDDGRAVGVVTYGSSTCVPMAGDATYAAGVLTVEIVDPEDAVCTRDYVPRATYFALPEGVDPAQDLEIVVTGTYAGDVDIDGDPALTGVPGEMTDFEPTAGWFDSDGFLLLTHGSSTCVSVISAVAITSPTEVSVTFVDPPADQVCTADMAGRIAVVALEDDGLDDDLPITAVLNGDGFAAVSVPIAGRP